MRLKAAVALVTVAFLLAAAGCAHNTSLTRENENVSRTVSAEPSVTGIPASSSGSTTEVSGKVVEVEQTTETRVIERTTVP
ncbi:MAG: hypothetical protein J7M19_06710 [Planctomycetes bacterium]|nr:hypothetical protein [Planctomycetota bacterium]